MSNYSILNFFDIRYWFNPNPVFNGNEIAFTLFLYSFILIFLGGVGAFLYIKYANRLSKIEKGLWKGIGIIMIRFSLIGLIWVFFRYQNVYILSMRIWMLLVIMWTVYSFYSLISDYKYQKSKIENIKVINAQKYKYIPSKKKK